MQEKVALFCVGHSASRIRKYKGTLASTSLLSMQTHNFHPALWKISQLITEMTLKHLMATLLFLPFVIVKPTSVCQGPPAQMNATKIRTRSEKEYTGLWQDFTTQLRITTSHYESRCILGHTSSLHIVDQAEDCVQQHILCYWVWG